MISNGSAVTLQQTGSEIAILWTFPSTRKVSTRISDKRLLLRHHSHPSDSWEDCEVTSYRKDSHGSQSADRRIYGLYFVRPRYWPIINLLYQLGRSSSNFYQVSIHCYLWSITLRNVSRYEFGFRRLKYPQMNDVTQEAVNILLGRLFLINQRLSWWYNSF